ncbi:hypothetical protein GALL_276630 [mine drainage metagenome]|uniref:Uncharacterized protein n=1 Tax=mine drainage metagenome TaxID=410659 RepID=A0A1J5RQT1_9ZZZZ
MKTKKCILTEVILTEENDSKAHVLPSALGGRFKPKGILSNAANEILNDKFDLPLIRTLHPFMALLGGARDRGENTPTRMTDKYGQSYFVVFGKSLELTEPKFKEEKSDNGTTYQITARNMKEARTLLGIVKKNHPEFDIEDALQQAVVKESYVDGMLHINLNIGANVFFPAAFAMASIFAASKQMKTHPEFIQYVQSFEAETPLNEPENTRVVAVMPPDTFYWSPSQTWFKVTSEISHVLIYFADPQRNKAFFYVELFNLPGVAVVLPYDGSLTETHTYGVDVISGVEVEVEVDTQFLQANCWQPTHSNGDTELFELSKSKIEKILSVVHARSQNHAIGKIIEKELGPPDGRQFTKEDIGKISQKIAEFMVRQIVR